MERKYLTKDIADQPFFKGDYVEVINVDGPDSDVICRGETLTVANDFLSSTPPVYKNINAKVKKTEHVKSLRPIHTTKEVMDSVITQRGRKGCISKIA